MGAAIDVLNPERPKRIAIVASNPSVSGQTGWPIGFWWSELTHPYWAFIEHGYQVDIYSPNGGKLVADNWSDPRDESRYSATDLISLGFISSPDHMKLVENSKSISQLDPPDYGAVLFVGGKRRCTRFTQMLACMHLSVLFTKLEKLLRFSVMRRASS